MGSGLGFRRVSGSAKGCCVLTGWNCYHFIDLETEVQQSSRPCLGQVQGLSPKDAQVPRRPHETHPLHERTSRGPREEMDFFPCKASEAFAVRHLQSHLAWLLSAPQAAPPSSQIPGGQDPASWGPNLHESRWESTFPCPLRVPISEAPATRHSLDVIR